MDSRITGCCSSQMVSPVVVILETYSSSDIAGIYLVQLLSLVRVHLQDTADTLLLALGGSSIRRNRNSCVPEYTRKNASLPTKRVGHDLECQSCENGSSSEECSLNLVAFHINTLDGRNINRSGHILQNSVQKLLNALVSVCACRSNTGIACTLAGALSQSSLQIFHRRLFALPDTASSDHHPARRSSRSARCGTARHHPSYPREYRR